MSQQSYENFIRNIKAGFITAGVVLTIVATIYLASRVSWSRSAEKFLESVGFVVTYRG